MKWCWQCGMQLLMHTRKLAAKSNTNTHIHVQLCVDAMALVICCCIWKLALCSCTFGSKARTTEYFISTAVSLCEVQLQQLIHIIFHTNVCSGLFAIANFVVVLLFS